MLPSFSVYTAVVPFTEHELGVRDCASPFLLFNPSTQIVEPLLCARHFSEGWE